MGFLDRLLHNNAAVIGMKMAEADAHPTPATSIPLANGDSWPSDAEFYGGASGVCYREYAVRVVIDFITRNIASLPFKVYRKNADGDAEEVISGALSDLMKRPSPLPGMTRYRFISMLLRDMLLDDRWLCLLGVDGGRFTLRRIPSDCYQLSGNSFGEITGVNLLTMDSQRAMHFDLPDPRVHLDVGFISGLQFGDSVTNVLRPLLAEAKAMAAYRRNIAKNGMQAGGYVYRPKEMPWLSQEDYDDFTNGLRNFIQNGGREGGWPVLKDGMEMRPLDNVFKPVDVNDLEARDRINIAVCNAFQISPENVGFRTGTNSNISAFKEQLWNVELMPYIVALEEALNLSLPEAVGEPDCYIKANVDAKLRGTTSEQYQALSTATGRPFMTTNQARQILDMPRVPGGDQLITPLNVSEGGQPSPQDGGKTQNAQENNPVNGEAAKAMLAEFKRLYRYDAQFHAEWDALTKEETS